MQKNIFGEDIVKSATIDTKFSDKRKIDVDKNYIYSIDACPLTITFVNENKVNVWVSEWGGIDSVV